MEGQQEQPTIPFVTSKNTKNQGEIIARLLCLNPAILSQFFGIGTHAFLDQFFRLWPSFRIQALPYLSIPAVLLGSLGWKVGLDSVRNPNDEIRNDP